MIGAITAVVAMVPMKMSFNFVNSNSFDDDAYDDDNTSAGAKEHKQQP